MLGLVTVTLTLAVLSHALVDIGRRALDTLFFGSEVRRLRSNLSSVVQTAALTQDLDQVLDSAQTEIAEVSTHVAPRHQRGDVPSQPPPGIRQPGARAAGSRGTPRDIENRH
jgi:hypothetical protein